MWWSSLGCRFDPFQPNVGDYIPTPPAELILNQLRESIGVSSATVILCAPRGAGKSRLLRELIARSDPVSERFSIVDSPSTWEEALVQWAIDLGTDCWPTAKHPRSVLEERLRIAELEEVSTFLVLDGGTWVDNLGSWDWRDQPQPLVPPRRPRPAGLLIATREESAYQWLSRHESSVAISPQPLTRTQAEHYLREKLERAGSDHLPLKHTTLTRLHAESSGWPGLLEESARSELLKASDRTREDVSRFAVSPTNRPADTMSPARGSGENGPASRWIGVAQRAAISSHSPFGEQPWDADSL